MKIKFKIIASAAVLAVLFSSCQKVFTTSAFSFVEINMNAMKKDQKISYAEDLLISGTTDELAAAYTQIEDLLPDDLSTADPDLVILAADLAIGSSGVGDAVTGALEVFTSGAELNQDTFTAIFKTINTDNLSSAVALIEAAEDMEGVTLTPEQYTNAAAAQVLVVIDDAGGLENLASVDPADPDLVQALAWAEAGGVDLASMMGGLSLP